MAEKEYTVVAPDGKEITLIGPVGASQEEVIAQAQKLYNPKDLSIGQKESLSPKNVMLGVEQKLKQYLQGMSLPNANSITSFANKLSTMPTEFQRALVSPQTFSESLTTTPLMPEQTGFAAGATGLPEKPPSETVLDPNNRAYMEGYDIGQPFGYASVATPFAGAAVKGVKKILPIPSYSEMKGEIGQIASLLRQKEQSTLSGVGSAEVPETVRRTQLAENLRVPVKLSKGQATRELGQQAFEAETPKAYPDVGKPLVQAQAGRNEAILQNFDAFVDATGKEAYGLRATGKIVDDALVNASKKAKTEINNAYQKARDAGETAELVDVTPVQKFLSGLEAESINAPIIKSAEVKLNSLAKDGKMSINDLEEIRKMIGNLSGSTPTNMLYGKQINKLIDSTTETAGGQLYKDARALRAKYAREFENVGVVDKLLSKKPGTSDRSVALEDVFSHSVLNGSLDDVRNIGKTLKKAGPEGEQAWKELQGQTIEHIKDQVTRNIDTDSFGNPVVSPAKFKAIVRELDQDGKLDYIFGKKGAQEIRDLLETTILVNAPVKGAVNQSNTASALIRAMDKIKGSPLGKIPGVGAVTEYGTKQGVKKQVEEALNFDANAVAKELRKGK